MQPWLSPRPGGASRKRLRGEPKRNGVFALLQRETASAFWAEGACGAPGDRARCNRQGGGIYQAGGRTAGGLAVKRCTLHTAAAYSAYSARPHFDFRLSF